MINNKPDIRLVVSGIAFVLGMIMISIMPPLRIDLTESKLYTLSDGTIRLIRHIEDGPVIFKFYYSDTASKNIPRLRTYAKRVTEILREYELQSSGNIKLKIINPEPFSQQEDEASADGLLAVPAGNDDSIYLGLVIETTAGKKETIDFFNPEKESSLEYDISQLLFRAQQKKPVVAGVISELPVFQHRNPSSPQVIKPKVILEKLREIFEVKRVFDVNIDSINDDIDLLIVVHPHLWPERTLDLIDQFVLKGGKLLVLMDPYAEMDQSEDFLFGGGFKDRSSSLDKLLLKWGVAYDPSKVVLDYGYAHAIPVTRYGQALPHVGVIGVRDDSFNRESSITRNLDQVNFATPGALSAIPGASTMFTPLIRSSAESQLVSTETYHGYGNHGTALQHFKSDGEGPRVLAAHITGKVESAEISVVLVADTDIIDDRMWVQVDDFYGKQVATPFSNNADFMINALEQLSGSSDLIYTRSRGSYNRPFDQVIELEQQASLRFSEQQDLLMQKLEETERQLMELQSNEDPSAMKHEIQKFESERFEIRKNLREVKHQLNQDIENLGSLLKMLNILLVPLLLAGGIVVFRLFKRKPGIRHS